MNSMNRSAIMCGPSPQVNLLTQWAVRFVLAMLLVYCLNIVTAQYSNVYAQETISHTVRAGETMSSIAKRYGVSLSALISYNSSINANLLRPGQILTVPVASQSAPQVQPEPAPQSTPRPTTVTTRSPVYPTPTPTRPVSATRYYTVRQNDTLYGIAARYGVTVEAVKARNGITGSMIYVGQLLAIP